MRFTRLNLIDPEHQSERWTGRAQGDAPIRTHMDLQRTT